MSDPFGTEARIFNRDEVLVQIDGLLQIQDKTKRDALISVFIDNRLKTLTESTVPREFFMWGGSMRGFIHPGSDIRPSLFSYPFHVDDPEIYRLLFDVLIKFERDPELQDWTLRDKVPYAILETIGKYFGKNWGAENTDYYNQEFYNSRTGDDEVHLIELKDKGIAVCSEKAATAQNLLTFLGYQSELILSSRCRLKSIDEEDQTNHVYNLITREEDHLIFDPTNPILVRNKDDSIREIEPAFYSINQDEYTRLIKGGQVRVIHNDATWDGKKRSEGPDQHRIYGGPDF